jgi:hypothetical protein
VPARRAVACLGHPSRPPRAALPPAHSVPAPASACRLGRLPLSPASVERRSGIAVAAAPLLPRPSGGGGSCSYDDDDKLRRRAGDEDDGGEPGSAAPARVRVGVRGARLLELDATVGGVGVG